MISILCLGVCVVAILFSVEYHDEFKRFSTLNRQEIQGGYCDQSATENQCMCFEGRTLQVFKDGFKCKYTSRGGHKTYIEEGLCSTFFTTLNWTKWVPAKYKVDSSFLPLYLNLYFLVQNLNWEIATLLLLVKFYKKALIIFIIPHK